MNAALHALLQPVRLTEVVDIGANPIDGDPPYKPMLRAGLCRVTGYEPQDEALARLDTAKGPNERYLPYAVGDGKTRELKICRESGMTSLLEPDPETLKLFDYLRPLGDVIRRVPVVTTRLDDIVEIRELDFLKMDIQGGELAVFQNGRAKLAHTVVIQTEVSFITLYKEQPTFADIDSELRAQGFLPHCFAAIKKWPIAPLVVNKDPREAVNQLLEADIVYVRDFTHLDRIASEALKHLILVAHYCYQSVDLALRCVLELEHRHELPPGSDRKYLGMAKTKLE